MVNLLQYIFSALLLLVQVLALAQVSIGGMPLSFSAEFQTQYGNTLPRVQSVASPDIKGYEAIRKSQTDRRISLPISLDFDLNNSGEWLEMSNGDRIWRLQLRAADAKGLVVLYDNFSLPPGSKLFVYSPDRQQLLGAYTASNNDTTKKRFLTGIIQGDALVIEYFEPAYAKNKGSLHLFRLDYILEPIPKPLSDYPFQVAAAAKLGFGTSSDCHININCQQGDAWQTVKRGVCRIMMVLEEGIGWCSGTVLNNTEGDGKPYLLSAYHCQDGYTPMYDLWRFDFNYESPNCLNPTTEPAFVSVLGSELRASWQNTDFLLLEIRTIPSAYQVYFNGWNKNATVPSQTTLIHHPTADIKKITTQNKAAQIYPASILWNNAVTTPPNHHFRVTFDQGGTFQMGSSGGGLFDQNQRLVAQLHGGFPDTLCRITTAYLGRFALSWEGGGTAQTRLKDWLDPNSKNLTQIEGIENPADHTFVLQGKVTLSNGAGVADVVLTLAEGLETKTDLAGNYFFDALARNQVYEILPTKNTNLSNGLSAFDLLKIQKHLLNTEPFTSSVQMIAADVNRSASISALDLLAIQKVLLNKETTFPNNTSWRFVPEIFNLANTTAQDFDFQFPESYKIENPASNLTINFLGIKVGDTNGSADGKE